MRRGVLIAVAVAGSLALGACDDEMAKPGDTASALGPAAAATSSATATTADGAATAPATPSLSPSLTAALNALSEKARALGAPGDIRDKLQAGNDALGTARAGVNKMRDNAYGSSKSCSVVLSQRSVVLSNTSVASGNASSALQLLTARRPQVTALTEATNGVEAVMQAEGTPLDSLPSVKQAVTSARQQVADENDTMSKLSDGANAMASNARDLRGNAEQIAAKAC